MKPISELGKQAVRARLKKLKGPLSPEQIAERTQLEAREWELYRIENPPKKTPPNFIEKDSDWDW